MMAARRRSFAARCLTRALRAGQRGFAREDCAPTSICRAALAIGRRPASASPRRRRTMEAQYYRAIRELLACIKPTHDATPILNEGGVYLGCWLESTGTINTEILSRFMPRSPTATYSAFAAHQRDDGHVALQAHRQRAARSTRSRSSRRSRAASGTTICSTAATARSFARCTHAMARYDAWLARYRDTRGTGGVEAFCAFDTGHDLSSRFWHMPDTPFGNDGRALQSGQSAPAACRARSHRQRRLPARATLR